MKTNKTKELLIEQLKKTPIVQIACEKSGVARATYYRWRKNDKSFLKKSDEALMSGKQIINDLAESKLFSAIKEQNMTAIIFWLKNNHPSYANKVEITNKIDSTELTKEQKELINKALKLI